MKVTTATSASTSAEPYVASLVSNNNDNFINNLVAKYCLYNFLEASNSTPDISFGLSNQITLPFEIDIISLLAHGSRDAATINMNCSVATIASLKSYLAPRLNYVLPKDSPSSKSNTNIGEDFAAPNNIDTNSTATTAPDNKIREI